MGARQAHAHRGQHRLADVRLILYIFATGVVKGFGFALGLSTIIDLAVLFWFTKPLVSWFARFRFFNAGGKLSGLSPETLGTDEQRAPVVVGGKA